MQGGSFWSAFGMRFGGGGGGGGIDEVLERDNCCLEDLLDHDDVIQECKYMNAQLIEFLSHKHVVEKLIRYVIALPPDESLASKDDNHNNDNNNENDHQENVNENKTNENVPVPSENLNNNENPSTTLNANTSSSDPLTSNSSNTETTSNENSSNNNSSNNSDNPHDSNNKSSSDENNNSSPSSPLPIGPVSISLLSRRSTSSRYPYVASELFACEVVSMLDVVCEDNSLLDLLFSFLEKQPAPLDPSHAAYFRKVVVVLIQRKYDYLVKYIANASEHDPSKTSEDSITSNANNNDDTNTSQSLTPHTSRIITALVNHIGLYSVMELLIMVGWDDGLGQLADTDWLAKQGLVDQLVQKLSPSFDNMPDVHMNAARALVDVVVKCPPAAKSNLVSNLQSTSVLSQIFKHMFSGSQSSLTHSMSIIIVLVQRYANRRAELTDEVIGEGDSQRNDNGELVEEPFLSLLPHLPSIIALLSDKTSPSAITSVATQFGNSIPFGETRMKVVELCLVLLRSHVHVVDLSLIQLNVLPLLVDVFFAFPWNNMLHGLVESIIRTVLDQEDEALKQALFDNGRTVDKFIKAYEYNEECMNSIASAADGLSGPCGVFRPGYMGHLIRTSLAIEEICSKHDQVRHDLLGESSAKWTSFMQTKIEFENERQRAAAPFNNEEDLLDALQFDNNSHAHSNDQQNSDNIHGQNSQGHKDDDVDPYHFSEELDEHDNPHLGYDYGSGGDADAESWRDTDMGVHYQEWSDFSQAFAQTNGPSNDSLSHSNTSNPSSNDASSEFNRGSNPSNHRSIIEFSSQNNDSDDDENDEEHQSHTNNTNTDSANPNQSQASVSASGDSNQSQTQAQATSGSMDDDFEVNFPDTNNGNS